MTEANEYLGLAAASSGELKDKGSRFLARVLPVHGFAEAREQRDRIAAEARDASHHCWAVRVGWPPEERWSDAGEPHGTAGEPIARVLGARGLSDVAAVVTRWFGGTKLGKGGLARAYSGAVVAALENARFVRRFPTARLVISLPYERLGAVKRLLRPGEVEWREERYGARVEATLEVRSELEREVREALADLRVTIAKIAEEGS